MKSTCTIIAAILILTSACTSFGQPPVSGFGSALPNGAITHNGEIESYIGLGENDSEVGYVVGNYRCGFDFEAPREFKVEELGAVMNVNDTVTALWSEVPTTVRVFRNGDTDTVLMTGTEGPAPAIATTIAKHLGRETTNFDNNVDVRNVYVLTIVDTGYRVLVHRKRLAGTHAATALVYDTRSAITFLSADLLPRPEDDLPSQHRN